MFSLLYGPLSLQLKAEYFHKIEQDRQMRAEDNRRREEERRRNNLIAQREQREGMPLPAIPVTRTSSFTSSIVSRVSANLINIYILC